MTFARPDNFASLSLRLAAAVALCAGFSLLAGCKGNTSAAAMAMPAAGKPPELSIHRIEADPRVSPSAWGGAQWMSFNPPINTSRTTPPTRGAVAFDAAALYVSVLSQEPATPAQRDAISVYIDTSPTLDGTELLRVALDSTGSANCTWLRAAAPAEAHPDGSPDLGHTLVAVPNFIIRGLWSRVTHTQDAASGEWTAVVAIPFKSLPGPLLASPAAGAHWKINVLRTVNTNTGEQLQSNLSPVYVGAQEFSPDRLADVRIP